MRQNLITGLLITSTLFFAGFAFYQKEQTDRQIRIANEMKERMDQNRAEAERQNALAEKIYKECQKSGQKMRDEMEALKQRNKN